MLFKRLLISIFLIAGFTVFANESKEQASLSSIILFVDFEKVRTESDEWNCLQAKVKFINEQQRAVEKKSERFGIVDATQNCDEKKRNEGIRLREEARVTTRAYLEALESPLSLWNRRMKVIIHLRAKELKAGAVINKQACTVPYLDISNDITDYVISELNREYRQSAKQIYPTCDLYSFIDRMNEIGPIFFTEKNGVKSGDKYFI